MNIQNLLGQFGGMMSMMKGGSNPAALLSMLAGSNSDLSKAFQEAQRMQQEKGSQGFEDFVKEEFKKAGLDISDVRRTLGI